MPYSLDLRKKVIDYLQRRGGVTKASQIFQVSRASIYRWLNRENLEMHQFIEKVLSDN
jgi:putative transposase